MALPNYIRFKTLQAKGIAESWAFLRNLIENYGFPPGKLLSPQIRIWAEDEVGAWVETRPVAPAEPRGIAASRRAQKAARLRSESSTQTLEIEADEATATTRGPPALGVPTGEFGPGAEGVAAL